MLHGDRCGFVPDLPFGKWQAANRKITGDLSDDVLIAIDLEVGPVDLSGIGGKVGVRQAKEAASPKAGKNVPARDHATGCIVETRMTSSHWKSLCLSHSSKLSVKGLAAGLLDLATVICHAPSL